MKRDGCPSGNAATTANYFIHVINDDNTRMDGMRSMHNIIHYQYISSCSRTRRRIHTQTRVTVYVTLKLCAIRRQIDMFGYYYKCTATHIVGKMDILRRSAAVSLVTRLAEGGSKLLYSKCIYTLFYCAQIKTLLPTGNTMRVSPPSSNHST